MSVHPIRSGFSQCSAEDVPNDFYRWKSNRKMDLIFGNKRINKNKQNTYALFGVELICGAKTKSMPPPLTCSLASFSPNPSNDSPPSRGKNQRRKKLNVYLHNAERNAFRQTKFYEKNYTPIHSICVKIVAHTLGP